MVLKKNSINQTFLLPLDIRTMIPDNHVYFLVEKLVNCVDFSDIDFEFMDTPCQKAFPAALLIHIIVLGMIYAIHTSRKLERIVHKTMYLCILLVLIHLFSVHLLLLKENIRI